MTAAITGVPGHFKEFYADLLECWASKLIPVVYNRVTEALVTDACPTGRRLTLADVGLLSLLVSSSLQVSSSFHRHSNASFAYIYHSATYFSVESSMDPIEQPENVNTAGQNGEDGMAVDPPADLECEPPMLFGDPMDVDEVFMDVDCDVEHGENGNGVPMDVDEVFVHSAERGEAVPMEVDEVFGGNEGAGESAAGVQRGADGRGLVVFNCAFEIHIHIHRG
ncbi:hypothetical protein DENSPDRAFT_885091 [Dentipellis sp. KUC8613]|nr:hypothetical protein DENSPDRAFT_885091 [Dentipellis sp. KUC8613]